MGLYFEEGYNSYKGVIGRDLKSLPKNIYIPYLSWGNQLARCNNPNRTSYKTYGKAGIKVIYSRRQLIQWYLDNTKHIPDSELNNYSIGRIDHSKHYCIANLKIELKSENSKERTDRLGSPSIYKKIKVKVTKQDGSVDYFDSINEMKTAFNINSRNNAYYINGGLINGLHKMEII